jgi:sugar phosphate isomerase/epimerase
MIELGCCAFVFGLRSLDEALRLVSSLGFRHVDVSAADIGPRAQVDQQVAARHPLEEGRRLRQLARRYGLTLDELFLCPIFVNSRRVEANDPDVSKRTRLLEQFRRLCDYAAAAGLKSVMGVPGVPQEGLSPDRAWELSVRTLTHMVDIARGSGVRLNVEPHHGSIVEHPARAVQLALDVPGLTYTLDYAHFAMQAIPESEVFPLHAHTKHMHARQARPGKGGCPIEEGTIDFPAIIADLKTGDWDGVIAMEYFAGIEPVLRHSGAFQNVVLAHQLDQLIGHPQSGREQGIK